jgi:hypothetical protein
MKLNSARETRKPLHLKSGNGSKTQRHDRFQQSPPRQTIQDHIHSIIQKIKAYKKKAKKMRKKVKKGSSSLTYTSHDSSPVKNLELAKADENLRLKVPGVESSTPFLTLNNEDEPDDFERPVDFKKQFNNFMIVENSNNEIQIQENNIGSNIFFGLNDKSIKNNDGLSFNNSSSATFLNNENQDF